MVLTVFSAQNIDRLVTVYRAALQSGRDLVMDLYTASIVKATANENIPHPGDDWPRVHVFVPVWQRVKVKQAGQFHRVEEIRGSRVYVNWLATNRHRLVTMFSVRVGPPWQRRMPRFSHPYLVALVGLHEPHRMIRPSVADLLGAAPDTDGPVAHLGACLDRGPRETRQSDQSGSHCPDPLLRTSPVC